MTVVGLGILAALPSWLDLDVARTWAVILAVVGAVLLIIALFKVRSVGVRIVLALMLGAAVFGLLHYRQTLDHCDKSGCECSLLGEDLEGGGCGPAR